MHNRYGAFDDNDDNTGNADLGPPCAHQWAWISDWYGDPSVPHGTQDCSHWECRKCGEQDWEHPQGYYGPDPDSYRE